MQVKLVFVVLRTNWHKNKGNLEFETVKENSKRFSIQGITYQTNIQQVNFNVT